MACTLGAVEFGDRLDWIKSLTREALREHQRDDLVLRLIYAPKHQGRVREMVKNEKACCAFLGFDLTESEDAIRLHITVPEEARDAADTLFAPFLPGAT